MTSGLLPGCQVSADPGLHCDPAGEKHPALPTDGTAFGGHRRSRATSAMETCVHSSSAHASVVGFLSRHLRMGGRTRSDPLVAVEGIAADRGPRQGDRQPAQGASVGAVQPSRCGNGCLTGSRLAWCAAVQPEAPACDAVSQSWSATGPKAGGIANPEANLQEQPAPTWQAGIMGSGFTLNTGKASGAA